MSNPFTALLVGSILLAASGLLFWPNGGVLGYLQRVKQLNRRVLREDALKHLHKSERHGGKTTIESMAGALQINTTQAARLIEYMQKHELVTFQGGAYHLTPTGRDNALRVIRAHRLWERYLSDETGFDEAEWHGRAEQQEHIISPEQVEILAAQLGNPTHDPHGDPIPTASGEIVHHGGEPLPSMPLDAPLRIVHIEDEPDTVYAQLIAERLYLGMEVRITENSHHRVRFWANGDEHTLAPIVAANISVVTILRENGEEPFIGESLNHLELGQQGEVISLSPHLRGPERRRMMDLGLLPGTLITAEISSPSHDPIAYRIRGALIALRSEQAELIRVEILSKVSK